MAGKGFSILAVCASGVTARHKRLYPHCLRQACAALLIFSVLTALGCGAQPARETQGFVEQGGGAEVSGALVWPTPYQNPARTGRSSAVGPQSNEFSWTWEAGSESESWAVLAEDGSVLAGFRGRLVCLDPANGSLKWEYPTGSEAPSTCDVGPDGAIYFAAGNGIHALDSQGRHKWSFDMGVAADHPAVGKDAVYAGSTGGRLVAMDFDGGLKWEASMSGEIRSPSIDKQGNLYCSGSSFSLHAFSSDGNKLWDAYPAGDLSLGEGLYEWANTLDTPSIGQDGTIYAGSMTGPLKGSGSFPQMLPGDLAAGKLYAFSPQGQLKWSYTYPSADAAYFSIHSPSIGQDGTLYCGTTIWRVLALSPQGQLVWEFNIGEVDGECPSVYSPSIGRDGQLYAATTSGKMICITAQGLEKWRYECGNPWLSGRSRSNNMTPPPLDARGNLFSVLSEGKVLAWKGAGGQAEGGRQPAKKEGNDQRPGEKTPL